jgi:hypothetical protein
VTVVVTPGDALAEANATYAMRQEDAACATVIESDWMAAAISGSRPSATRTDTGTVDPPSSSRRIAMTVPSPMVSATGPPPADALVENRSSDAVAPLQVGRQLLGRHGHRDHRLTGFEPAGAADRPGHQQRASQQVGGSGAPDDVVTRRRGDGVDAGVGCDAHDLEVVVLDALAGGHVAAQGQDRLAPTGVHPQHDETEGRRHGHQDRQERQGPAPLPSAAGHQRRCRSTRATGGRA